LRQIYIVGILIISILLTGCSTSSGSPTTAALSPTQPSIPTSPPTAEATAVPTMAPTSIPTPAPGTMDPVKLGLSSDFVAIPMTDLGKKIPAKFQTIAGFAEDSKNTFQVKWTQFPLENSFAFTNSDSTSSLYGFTVSLPETKDQNLFDSTLMGSFYAEMRLTTYPPDVSKIKDVTVGDKSVAVTAKYKIDNAMWHLNVVVFRINKVGAFVFTLYNETAGSPIDIGKLAQAYADGIKQTSTP
jgi:hypothetical protein